MADGEFGLRLKRARGTAGLTQEELSGLVGMGRVALARIEGGADPFTSHAGALYAVLSEYVPDLSLEWFLLGSGKPPAGRVGDGVKISRRRLIRAAPVVAAALVVPVPIDLEQLSAGVDVAGAEAVTEGLLAQWYTVAPATLLPPVQGHLEALREHRTGPTRLLRAAGRAALLAGRLRIKLDRLDEAFENFDIAGGIADDIGDGELRALVLAARAGMYSAIARGPLASGSGVGRVRPDAERALALADAAVKAVAPGMSGRLLASALGRRAEELALAGRAREREALRDLEDAERALEEPDDGRMYFGARNGAELGAIRGNVELLLGRNLEAVHTLNGTLMDLDPSLAQWRAAVLADQGAALARAGELEAAVDRLERALQLARLAGDHVGRVAAVRRRDLVDQAVEPAVRRLDEQLAAASL